MILTLKYRNCILGYSFLSLLLIFVSNIVSTRAAGPQLQPVYDFENYKVMEWRQLKLVLKCTNSTTAKLEWRKGDTVIKESEKYKLEPTSLVIEKPTDDETGNYTCTDLASNASVPFIVISRPFARLPDNTIVIEGESLTLECQTGGVPTPTIKWKIGNEILNGSTDRITLKAKGDIADAILYIKEVTMDDRNNYYCIASNIGNYNNMTTAGTAKSMVRVKDKLAALWPFLGICAEVFVLCAIILIYEKKRNKAELEESDTDNSPEQKNTPDHGKDSIRHRK
ncbi:basigin isoform X1 [Schistocerca serialis cubense]|uniref:basigin isoform X1 n=1 Tax=Schistocerca serialis cubense TaxID=2023355 RepID=UPI00214E6425|nr:basigin isoform X1 [Schistocerca serialis cubense]